MGNMITSRGKLHIGFLFHSVLDCDLKDLIQKHRAGNMCVYICSCTWLQCLGPLIFIITIVPIWQFHPSLIWELSDSYL